MHRGPTVEYFECRPELRDGCTFVYYVPHCMAIKVYMLQLVTSGLHSLAFLVPVCNLSRLEEIASGALHLCVIMGASLSGPILALSDSVDLLDNWIQPLKSKDSTRFIILCFQALCRVLVYQGLIDPRSACNSAYACRDGKVLVVSSLSLKPAQTPLKNGPKPLAKLYNSPKNSRA